MARGRMVNKKISNSKSVNDLPESAQLLYTWIIPHLDCNGCFYGSARMIKNLVFPRKNYQEKRIEQWLKLMEKAIGTEKQPLIIRYFQNGEMYLFMPGFEGEQVGLRRDKEKPDFPTFDGKNTEKIGQTVLLRGREGEGEVEVEENKNIPPVGPPHPADGVIEILKGQSVDVTWWDDLQKDFQDIDTEEELKKFKDYWGTSGHRCKNIKLALRNWLGKAREIKARNNPPEDRKGIERQLAEQREELAVVRANADRITACLNTEKITPEDDNFLNGLIMNYHSLYVIVHSIRGEEKSSRANIRYWEDTLLKCGVILPGETDLVTEPAEEGA